MPANPLCQEACMESIKKGLLLIAATALVACGDDSSGGGIGDEDVHVRVVRGGH
jgi:hypothetical protein